MEVVVAVLAVAVVTWWFLKRRSRKCVKSEISGFSQGDLLDPSYRDEGVFEFHRRLIEKFPGQGIVELPGAEQDVFVVFGARECRRVMEDAENFSSNPFVDERLVALNTMEKTQHDRLVKFVKNGYSTSRVKDLEFLFEKILIKHALKMANDGDLHKMTKRFHMEVSLVSSGLVEFSPNAEISDKLIDAFIRYNDAGVRLMAPLGGLGVKSEISWSRVVRGMWTSVSGMVSMVRTVGFVETWKLLRPDLFFRSRTRPYPGVWEFPELLAQMPEYFVALWTLMAGAAPETPVGNLRQGVCSGAISASEALAVAVQLMVNMTTANALMNLFHTAVNSGTRDVEQLVADSLHRQAPLMRNPRRAKRAVELNGVQIPKDALVLVLIGAGNAQLPASESLSFGAGMHVCLGRHLVHAEMRIFAEWLVDTLKKKTWKSQTVRRLVDVDVGNFGFSEYRGTFAVADCAAAE